MLFERIRQKSCRLGSVRTCRDVHITIDTAGVEIGSGTQNGGTAVPECSRYRPDTCQIIIFIRNDLRDFLLSDLKMLLLLQRMAHERRVGSFVRLCPQ